MTEMFFDPDVSGKSMLPWIIINIHQSHLKLDANREIQVSPTRRLGDGRPKTSKAHPGTLSCCLGTMLVYFFRVFNFF